MNKIYKYSKILNLPSNGLSYDKFCFVSPLTNSFFYAINDILITRNETEFIASILNHLIELEISVLDMYFFDLIFIWQYVYNTAFSISSIEKHHYCEYCRESNALSIKSSQIEIKNLEEGASKYLLFEEKVNDKQVDFVFDRRRTKHNIESSQLNLRYSFKQTQEQELNDEEIMDFTLNLILPQLIEIRIDNVVIKENFKELILDMSKYHKKGALLVYNIFNKLFDNVDFGIMNNLSYSCKKCNKKNKIRLVDILSSSIYDTKIVERGNSIMNYFTFTDTKLITFEEILNIPIYLNDVVLKQLTETVGNKKEKNYSTPEEMGVGIGGV